jgi:hypothetical protein
MEIVKSANGLSRGVLDSEHIGISRLAGERLPSSASDSYLAAVPECKVRIIGATTAVTIGGGVANDTLLLSIHSHTALTGTCVIAGFLDEAGVAANYTIPAATVGRIDFDGAINEAGALTVTCSNVADDLKVMVRYRTAV